MVAYRGQAYYDKDGILHIDARRARLGGIMANSIYRADFIYKNLQIQQNVIGESFRHGVKKLLFLGSTCIYPRDAEQPIVVIVHAREKIVAQRLAIDPADIRNHVF